MKKAATITIRCDETFKKLIETYADKDNRNTSSYIINILTIHFNNIDAIKHN